ncbi:MAG: hypothetical protein COA94_08160 [Rickettsiales bacterium]|nr:MAG: hypothetical protein COA94_08160 [Rickettsiales bacterium]
MRCPDECANRIVLSDPVVVADDQVVEGGEGQRALGLGEVSGPVDGVEGEVKCCLLVGVVELAAGRDEGCCCAGAAEEAAVRVVLVALRLAGTRREDLPFEGEEVLPVNPAAVSWIDGNVPLPHHSFATVVERREAAAANDLGNRYPALESGDWKCRVCV